MIRILAAGSIALALATATACGAGADVGDSSSSGDAGTEAKLAPDASGAPGSAADGSLSAGGPADAANNTSANSGDGEQGLTATPDLVVSAAADRQQVFTASADVKVDSLDDAVAEGAGLIEGLGGFAANEDVDLSGSNHATIVYRVPAPQFRPALAALSKLGHLRSQTIDSTDVTSQYADLEGRVTTLQTSIGRLQGFLAETTDVNQVASLEGELTRREAELESIEAQRRAMADQITLSTITVSFDATTASPATTTDRTGFMGGLDAGWNVALDMAAGALATLGFLLPFLPLVLIAGALIWWVRRRRAGRPLADSQPAEPIPDPQAG